MTFEKFESIFKTKYPEGMVIAHGKFGGTEHNNKTAIVFNSSGKVYEYYGAYEDILNRIGVKCISLSRLNDFKAALKRAKDLHGKPNPFSLFDTCLLDESQEIERLEKIIKDIEENYIII